MKNFCLATGLTLVGLASGWIPDFAYAQSAAMDTRFPPQLLRNAKDSLEDSATKILELLADIDAADEESGYITKGKADYQNRLNKSLSSLLSSLTGQTYANVRDELLKLDATIADERTKISELRTSLKLADKGNGTLSVADKALFRTAAPGSENDINSQISAHEQRLANSNQSRSEVIDSFSAYLADTFRFHLDREQATALLYQANGGTIVQAKAILETLSALEQTLAVEASEGDNPAATQKYYSVATVSRLVIVRMYQMHLADYDEIWLPKLAEIDQRNDRLIEETLQRMGGASAGARTQLQANLAVQRKVKEAILGYSNILLERRKVTITALAKAEEDAAVAVNSLKTIEGVFGLSAEMLSNTKEYNALMSIEAPELIPLSEGEMSKQYLEISSQIAGV